MFEKIIAVAKSNSVIAVCLSIGILFLGITSAQFLPEFNVQAPESTNAEGTSSSKVTSSPITNTTSLPVTRHITVDVQGEVQTPGVYQLSTGARISDALMAAGELTQKADVVWVARNINRATELHDGDKIYIPKKNEVASNQIGTVLPQASNNTSQFILGLSTQKSTPQPTSSEHKNKAENLESGEKSGKISINTASLTELDSLNGIGEKRAKDIIDNRPYSRIEELYERKIVFKSVYEKIKDSITI